MKFKVQISMAKTVEQVEIPPWDDQAAAIYVTTADADTPEEAFLQAIGELREKLGSVKVVLDDALAAVSQ